MKGIIALFLLFSISTSAQNRFSVSADIRMPDSIGTGVGGSFNYGFSIVNKVTVGAGFSVLKFDKLHSNYYPVYFHVAVHPFTSGRVSPMIIAEPGLGLYSHTENYSSTNRYSNKGGTSFFGGVGARWNLVGRVRPSLVLGYSAHTIKTSHHTQSIGVEYVTESKKSYQGFGARLGISF